MLPSYFNYIFEHLKQKVRLRPELSLKFLSTLSPNPTRKARPDLQLWPQRPETFTGFEVTTILQNLNATPIPLLNVDSSGHELRRITVSMEKLVGLSLVCILERNRSKVLFPGRSNIKESMLAKWGKAFTCKFSIAATVIKVQAVNINFYSLQFDYTGNRIRISHFSNRRTIHSTTHPQRVATIEIEFVEF